MSGHTVWDGRPLARMTKAEGLRDYSPTSELAARAHVLVDMIVVYLNRGSHRQEKGLQLSKGGPHDDVRGKHARAQPLGNGRR